MLTELSSNLIRPSSGVELRRVTFPLVYPLSFASLLASFLVIKPLIRLYSCFTHSHQSTLQGWRSAKAPFLEAAAALCCPLHLSV